MANEHGRIQLMLSNQKPNKKDSVINIMQNIILAHLTGGQSHHSSQ